MKIVFKKIIALGVVRVVFCLRHHCVPNLTSPLLTTLKPGWSGAAPKVPKPTGRLIQLLVIRTSSCNTREKSGCQSVYYMRECLKHGILRWVLTPSMHSHHTHTHYLFRFRPLELVRKSSFDVSWNARQGGWRDPRMSMHELWLCYVRVTMWLQDGMMIGLCEDYGSVQRAGNKTIEKTLAGLIHHKNWCRGTRRWGHGSCLNENFSELRWKRKK